MVSWTRRQFDSIGLTQSPPGPHLSAIQRRHGGTVLLCIDVSSSMTGFPLAQATSGGKRFLEEASKAHYECGLVLWNDGVHGAVLPGASTKDIRHALASAGSCGGTNLVPTLELAKRVLGPLTGDRVLCVFGDGDLGDRAGSVALARELCAMGVRILVRGLGQGATGALSELMCPGERDEEQLIDDVAAIPAGIASMATGLTNRPRHA